MKIGGKEVKGASEEYLVLPRPTGEDIVFHAVAVDDLDEFALKCPAPTPKRALVAGGWKENFDDPSYLESVMKHSELQYAYMVLKSLEPSNIEWDTVEMEKPSTWLNWEKDLKDAGLTQTEVNRVINCVSTANSLNEAVLEEARESFLRGLAKASEKSSGPVTEPQSTPSGTPA
jgi:hypothetical protein